MKIGILGSGMIGGTLARLFDAVGHHVTVANSRGSDSLAELVAELSDRARAGSVEEAIAFGEVVLLAIPYGNYEQLPARLLAGKIVVDTTNYTPDRDGPFPRLEGGAVTETELIARHLENARMVKAINTMNYATLADGGRPGAPRAERLVLFVAGDDRAANALLVGLIDELGFAAVETGSLVVGGRRQQPGSSVFNVALRPDEVQLDQPVG